MAGRASASVRVEFDSDVWEVLGNAMEYAIQENKKRMGNKKASSWLRVSYKKTDQYLKTLRALIEQMEDRVKEKEEKENPNED